MPETITCELQGLDQVQAKLKELPKKVGAKILRKALQKAAKVVIDAMVALAPKETGFLAKHFTTKTKIVKTDIAGHILVGPSNDDYPDRDGAYRIKLNKAGKAKLTGRIGVDDVARYHELGTIHEAKKPFISVAWEKTKAEAMNIIADALRQALGSE